MTIKGQGQEHGFSKKLKTDPAGFVATQLRSGTYRVTTSKFGFKNYVFDSIELIAGRPFERVYDLERGLASDDYETDRIVNKPGYDPCKHEDR